MLVTIQGTTFGHSDHLPRFMLATIQGTTFGHSEHLPGFMLATIQDTTFGHSEHLPALCKQPSKVQLLVIQNTCQSV